MNPSFREILELLNKYEVEYIVVGGVAAVIQGAPVTTFDLDALIRIGDENADRLSIALDELDARYREHQSKIKPTKDAVRMDIWLRNGTKERLTGLRVQNCVMPKMAAGFAKQSNDNKVLTNPYVACRSAWNAEISLYRHYF